MERGNININLLKLEYSWKKVESDVVALPSNTNVKVMENDAINLKINLAKIEIIMKKFERYQGTA